LTDLPLETSARRFASYLDREYCVWLSSPSVALLASLLSGRLRPKRLLVEANAPAFVSNLAVITGATVVTVSPHDIDMVLLDIFKTEGLKAEHVWGVAAHREGKLSPTDWLSRCVARGAPTVEMCLGSLRELARWSPFPATFTIVDLDAEADLSGIGLTALLTQDRALALRVRQLCLPARGAREYVLDATPRGLAADEAALAKLMDQFVEGGGAEVRFNPPPVSAWLSKAGGGEGEAHLLAGSQEKVEQLQRIIDQWEARFDAAEAEAARDAETLGRVRAELIEQRSESETALASLRAENEALLRRLLRAERERDLAVSAAAQKDESERGALAELQKRAEQLESEAESTASDAARLKAAADAAEAEKQALKMKLEALAAELEETRADAERRAGDQRQSLDEHQQRAAQLEKDVAILAAREAARIRESAAARTEAAERAASIETELEALKGQIKEAARREESGRAAAAEERRRADGLAAEHAASENRAARLDQDLAAARAEASEQSARLARLEHDLLAAEKARAELHDRHEGSERAHSLLQAERDTLARKLAAAEGERDAARAESEKRSQALHAALEEEKRRAAESEKHAAISSVHEATEAQAAAWEAERAELTARIARVEASANEAEKAHAELVRRLTAESERALAAHRTEVLTMEEKLTGLEQDRELARSEIATLQETRRVEAVEQQSRIDQLGTAAAETERALRAQGEAERDALRAERDALASRLLALEKEQSALAAEAARREEVQRAALDAATKRFEQLEKEAAALAARETKLASELEASRAEWTERVRRAEDAAVVARNANVGLMNRKNEAEQARASLQSELEEQMRLAQGLKMEAASIAAREAKKVEAAEAARAEMEARIARLEAAEAIADKARNELLSRKKETDKALAAAQAERATLLKRIAALESQGQSAKAGDAGLARVEPSGPSPDSPKAEAAGQHNTGGLSALLSMWNTAVIRRPARIKEKEANPPEPDAVEVFEVDTLPEETKAPAAPSASPPPPASPALEAREKPEPAPASAAAPKKPDRALPAKPPAPPPAPAKEHRTTGGLSALVNLWTTATRRRPSRRKDEAAKAGGQAPDPSIGIELIGDETSPVVEDAPVQGGAGRSAPEPPEKIARPRPTPKPRPEPKPAPPPAESEEKLGGWLRDLAGRMRGKK
jgi:chromosome segregation ATPase